MHFLLWAMIDYQGVDSGVTFEIPNDEEVRHIHQRMRAVTKTEKNRRKH
jgi:hypothetical protein